MLFIDEFIFSTGFSARQLQNIKDNEIEIRISAQINWSLFISNLLSIIMTDACLV